MRKTSPYSTLLLICFLGLSLSKKALAAKTESTTSQTKKTLLILHSYAMDYGWTARAETGIQQALEKHGFPNTAWQITHLFLDGKKRNKPAQIAKSVADAKKQIEQLKPDAVVICDDLALKSFYLLFKQMQIPVSFAGINGNPEDYGFQPGDKNATGSLERYNIPSVIKMLKRLRPSIDSVLFISEDIITGRLMLQDFVDQVAEDPAFKKPDGLTYTSFVNSSYEKLKARLRQVDPKKTIVVFISYVAYRDKAGKYVHYTEINKWVSENTQFLDIGVTTFYVEEGRLLGLVASANEIGFYSADLLLQGVTQDKDLSQFPVRQHVPLKLVINHQRAARLKVKIPFDILVYAATAESLENSKELK